VLLSSPGFLLPAPKPWRLLLRPNEHTRSPGLATT
jgi:hypothetical protein